MALLNTDQTPAAFWITNPDNTFINNVASGARYGFWYKDESAVTGVMAADGLGTGVCPRHARVRKFENNIAHSNSHYGLRIYHFLAPRVEPCNSNSRPRTGTFKGLLSYRNGKNGVTVTAQSHLKFVQMQVVENKQAGFEMASAQGGFIGGGWGANIVQDVVLVAGSSGHGIFTAADHGLTFDRITFVNYDSGSTYAVRGCAKCEGFTPRGGGWTTRFKRIAYDTSPNRVMWRWSHEGVHEDTDGTLVPDAPGGKRLSSLVPTNGLLPEFSDCATVTGYQGRVCNGMRFRRFAVN